MRKFMVLACVLSLFAVSAMAAETGSYPKAEFFGGYQYTRLQISLSTGTSTTISGSLPISEPDTRLRAA